MFGLKNGSFHLFRVAGIDVLMHWSWLLVAFYQMRMRAEEYESPLWKVAEYLTLFGIVLLHEFGHALACRQVGGVANQIILWPLGGVAYVRPPQRPGAVLWSIAAGPLVNVVLVPITRAARYMPGNDAPSDFHHFLFMVWAINLGLLIFNILPIYPLDGGQILRALLWFGLGPARSLRVATIIGLIGGVGLLGYAFHTESRWLIILTIFLLFQAFSGLMQSNKLAQLLHGPRRQNLACPSCGQPPPLGEFWVCNNCREKVDLFLENGRCPKCDAVFAETTCPSCQKKTPITAWYHAGTPAPTDANGPQRHL